MSHTIELRKVSKFYTNKNTVSTGFSRVDLTLDMGEFVVITGESGSGKSTLLNVISGLDTYEEGEMFVCGEDTSGYRTEDYERYRKTFIGNIFQDFNLVNSYSVYQNIELAMLISGQTGREKRQRINELIDMVDLHKYRRTKASRLSGGQKQRVAIARALAKDAPIIVADEPTGNLDSESAAKVMETLARISKDKLVVIVTHNYEQAEPYVTRKITMHDGKIIEDKRVSGNSPAGSASVPSPSDLSGANSVDLYNALSTLYERNPESHIGSMLPEEELERMTRSGSRVRRRTQEEAVAAIRPQSAAHKMRLFSQYKLGIRNTFNLPAKFILLLIVYLFVATAVISQYSSTKENQHQSGNLGWNDFFTNADIDRIILKKEDGTAFTDSDYAKIISIDNVDYIVKNDLALDTGIMAESEDVDISGPLFPRDLIDPDTITMGSMPEGDYDIAIEVSPDSWAYDTIQMLGDGIIGKEYYIGSYGGSIDYGERLIPQKVRISAVIVLDENAEPSQSGEARIYVSDELSNQVLIKNTAAASRTTIDFTGDSVTFDQGQIVFPSDEVEEGEVFISEDTAYAYYEEGYARGEEITVDIDNMYFSSSRKFTVRAVLTKENINYWLGFDEDDYDIYSERIFINPKDFDALYNQGFFQSSVFMLDETKSDETVQALNDAGYTTFVMKDSLTDVTGGFEFVVDLITKARLLFLFVVLFFIAYAVIRLIMRSRNTYYSTLRILGANKANTSRILRVELVLMMLIACGVCAGLIYLLLTGRIDTYYTYYITERLKFLTTRDYVLLFSAMLLMSLLIAQRYSRKIFQSSAMNVYREEV